MKAALLKYTWEDSAGMKRDEIEQPGGLSSAETLMRNPIFALAAARVTTTSNVGSRFVMEMEKEKEGLARSADPSMDESW